MSEQITENDYLDMLNGIEITPEMEKAIGAVLNTLYDVTKDMKNSERVVLGMRLATLISANTP